MNWLYERICIPLMQINNNVYTFLSGILISLSTNIFTTLCFEKFEWDKQWHIYLATILFATSGAICIFLATKMTPYQNYIISKQIIDLSERRNVIQDATSERKCTWVFSYFVLIITSLAGTALLIVNYAIIGS